MRTFSVFTCDQCGEHKEHKSEFSTGYGKNDAGQKICFACCGVNDRRDLLALPIGGKTWLYLSYNDGKYYVSNWPGTLKIPVRYMREGRHNIARKRYDVWFSLDGLQFHGVQYGDNTQVLHIKRIKP